jgi:hypothetical protein
MSFKRKALTCSVCAVVLCSAVSGANATCNYGGAASNKWIFHAIQASTPAIKSQTVTVRNSTGMGQVNIKVFPSTGSPFDNETATAIKCVLTISSTGAVSASPCTAWTVNTGGASVNVTLTGQLTSSGAGTASANACDFTGALNVAGDPTPVSIRNGHVIGTNGAGVATQGAAQVFHFTLVKF